MTPHQLAEFIENNVPYDKIDERPESLFIKTELWDRSLRERWLELRKTRPHYLSNLIIMEADGDSELFEDTTPPKGQEYRITLQKSSNQGHLLFFFPEKVFDFEEQFALAKTVSVAKLKENECFKTFSNEIMPWDEFPRKSKKFLTEEIFYDSRHYTKDFTGQNMVPSDIRPWMHKIEPEVKGAFYDHWRSIASLRLLSALTDSLSITSEGQTVFNFDGPPKCSFTPDKIDSRSFFTFILSSAIWVYQNNEGKDSETKHILFRSEFARAYHHNGTQNFDLRILESAKSAYAAYVKDRSKEILKSIAELRLSVSVEAQNISQRAQDLAKGIWRDLAIASLPFILRVLISDSNNQITIKGLAFGASFFIILSIYIQLRINRLYFERQEEIRFNTKKILSIPFSEKELREISDNPIERSKKDYNSTCLIIAFIYIFISTSLTLYAAFIL